MRTSYTWSKTTDNVSEIFASGAGGQTALYSQNPLCNVSCEHGLSGQDVPNSWTLGFVENLPFKRNQQGLTGHVLGGCALSSSYIVASGTPYAPIQFSLAAGTGGALTDPVLQSGLDGALRPFLGSPTAPVSSVGVMAADACALAVDLCLKADQKTPTALGVFAVANPNTVVNLNDINSRVNNGTGTTETYQVVGAKAVRFIVNGAQAQAFFGTPFGNVGRNTLRESITNSANFSVYKYIKVTEGVKVRFDTTFINVFNHPNFGAITPGIDPYLDDAGLLSEGTGFATPSLESGGNRNITFGLRVEF